MVDNSFEILFISLSNPFILHLRKYWCVMKLSHLSETLIGSEIVKLGGEIRERIRKGERIYNFTVGDFDPKIFPIPKELEDYIVEAYRQHFTNYPPGRRKP